MSKNVVVFSTYYNYPIYEDKLFNRSTCNDPTVGEFLKGFFVKRLKEDIEDPVWSHLLDYLNLSEGQKLKLEQNIEYARKNDIELIRNKIKEEIDIVNQFLKKDKLDNLMCPENYDDVSFNSWIIKLYKLKDDKYHKIIELHKKKLELIREEENYKKSYLRENIDLNHYNISDKGDQEVYDIYTSTASFPEGYPWLFNRMSYYELKSSDSATAVYAVWPLDRPSSPTQDGDDDGMISCEWIDMLKNQFLSLNNDCKTIYLCLHGKDVYGDSSKNVIYKLYGPILEENQVYVIVILFQHPKPIGNLLSERLKNSSDILEFVQKETLNLGLVKLKSTVSPKSINKTKGLLDFYNKYCFCKDEIGNALKKLEEYETCQDEKEKYLLGKELKSIIEGFKENL